MCGYVLPQACGMNGAEWQLRGRSGEEQYAGLGGVSSVQVLYKGSAVENKSWFFTEAVRHVDSGSSFPDWLACVVRKVLTWTDGDFVKCHVLFNTVTLWRQRSLHSRIDLQSKFLFPSWFGYLISCYYHKHMKLLYGCEIPNFLLTVQMLFGDGNIHVIWNVRIADVTD